MLSEPSDVGSVHVLRSGTATRVVLTGEVDAALGPELRGAADDARSAALPVEVDVRRVTFMDSTGLGFLARLADQTGRVGLVGASRQVRDLLRLTGLDPLVRLVDADPPRADG